VHVVNYGGRLGAYIADMLFMIFGLVSFVIPVALLAGALVDLRQRQVDARTQKSSGSCSCSFPRAALPICCSTPGMCPPACPTVVFTASRWTPAGCSATS